MAEITLTLDKLLELHRLGEVKKAKKGLLAYLKSHPRNADALHALSLISVEEKKLPDALEYLQKAIAAQPENPTLQLHLANVMKMQGLLAQATTLLKSTVLQHPQYAPAYNNLGTLYYAQGQLAEAVSAYRKALEEEPEYVDVYYNLGLALSKKEEWEEASANFRRLLELSPQHAPARYQLAMITMQKEKWQEAIALFLELIQNHPHHFESQVNLASCYLKLGSFLEAKKHYLQALQLEPQDPQVLFNLGYLSAQQGQLGEALRHYQELVRLNPDHYAAQHNLGVLLFSKKQVEPALYHLEEALRIKPENKSIQHLIAILKNKQDLLQSPPEYLKSLFDYYADHYEPHLLNILDYQVPQLLHKSFEASRKQMNKKLEILDLGCGTGLCGDVFKFHAEKLVGIDLSEKMLAQAADKKIYAELICGDLINYLQRKDASFDLVLAGDVFVYIGDLDPVLHAVHGVLHTGGLLIFNLEIAARDDYSLQPSGRFAHQKSYLEKLAHKNGFDLLSCQTAVTRMQDGKPVSGHIFVLQG